MNAAEAYDDAGCEEYVSAAEWCAARGIAGEPGDPLPENLSASIAAAIEADPEAFASLVRDATYAAAMELHNLPEDEP